MNKLKTLLPSLTILVVLIAFLLLFGSWASAGAFSGKCYTREGVLDMQCMKESQSRKVKMTYARDLPTYYRRSRSGEQWTNHVNRETTTAQRNRFGTAYYKSLFAQRERYNRIKVSIARESRDTNVVMKQYLNRARKQREERLRAQLAKYE